MSVTMTTSRINIYIFNIECNNNRDYFQAPETIKTLSISMWYFSVALGNLIVIIVNKILVFEKKVMFFFLPRLRCTQPATPRAQLNIYLFFFS